MPGKPAEDVGLYPRCVRMFHNALTFREVLVTGRTPPVCVSGSMKPRMPCLSGRLPVAMEFHSMGERMGRSVARFPMTPWLTKSSSVGINPWSRRGLIIFQSAASQPMSKTFFANAGMGSPMWDGYPWGETVYYSGEDNRIRAGSDDASAL